MAVRHGWWKRRRRKVGAYWHQWHEHHQMDMTRGFTCVDISTKLARCIHYCVSSVQCLFTTSSTYHDSSSPTVSSTLVGWQQMTTFDLFGSNREAKYWRPTRCRSPIVTLGIFCSSRLHHDTATAVHYNWQADRHPLNGLFSRTTW